MGPIGLRRRSIALGALAVLAVLVGFLFGTSVSGAEYATVGTVDGSHQAYAVTVDDDVERLRFELAAAGDEPHARLSIYDPDDAFMTALELTGDDDTVEVFTDQPGDWVVFMQDAQDANLTIQLAGAAADEDADLAQLPVRRDTRTLVEQGGGELDERVVWEVRRQPAGAHLEWSGDVAGLDAVIESTRGLVYEVQDGQASGSTRDAAAEEAHPANLAAGTYEASVTADRFAGELVFVKGEYIRDPVDLDGLTNEQKLDAVRNGTTVSRASAGEAIAFDTVSATEVLFVVDPDAHAHVRVFDDEDRFVQEVSLGSHEGECERECPDGHDGDSPRIAQFADLDEPGGYVAYIASIEGDSRVAIALPVDDAPEGIPLETEHQEMQFQHGAWATQPQRQSVQLDGALLEASVDAQDTASVSRNVTIDGPLGAVLYYEETGQSAASQPDSQLTIREDRFTSGRFEVTVQAGSAAGTTYVDLAHYVR